jgi:hypothetical protein
MVATTKAGADYSTTGFLERSALLAERINPLIGYEPVFGGAGHFCMVIVE